MDATAFFNLSYGMYIVSAQFEEKKGAQICNTAFQITPQPPVLAVSINKQNYTHELISGSKKFVLSILSTDATFQQIGYFGFRSGRDINKFDVYESKVTESGIPYIAENIISCFECDVVNEFDFGSHTVFSGEVKNSFNVNSGVPMTYSYYHKVIKGKTPKTAPSYVEES